LQKGKRRRRWGPPAEPTKDEVSKRIRIDASTKADVVAATIAAMEVNLKERASASVPVSVPPSLPVATPESAAQANLAEKPTEMSEAAAAPSDDPPAPSFALSGALEKDV